MTIEEHVARELLHYFTGQHPTGVKYDDMPEDVKALWLGAAGVAIRAVQHNPLGTSAPNDRQC
jgi:hypothetical protein